MAPPPLPFKTNIFYFFNETVSLYMSLIINHGFVHMKNVKPEKTSTKVTMDPEDARLLTYSTTMPTASPAYCLCINIHQYAPPRIVLHQTAALPALDRQYTSEGSMSSFKSVT